MEQSMGQFQRILKQNPSSFKGVGQSGPVLAGPGDNEKAVGHFLQASNSLKRVIPHMTRRTRISLTFWCRPGDAERAYAAAARAANSHPQSARNFYIGAKALEKLGKTDLC